MEEYGNSQDSWDVAAQLRVVRSAKGVRRGLLTASDSSDRPGIARPPVTGVF